MTDSFRSKVITTLIDEISNLTGGRFEQFGYKVLEVIHPGEWQERGTTVNGAPRGYTVDTSSNGGTNVAEMSSEEDYFAGKMNKPRRDLKHVLKLHPEARRIWLLSAREASAGETTKCANFVSETLRRNPALITFEIIDSRKLAIYIFENLESERFIAFISPYLPSVGRIADENAFSYHVPMYQGYLPRPELEKALQTFPWVPG